MRALWTFAKFIGIWLLVGNVVAVFTSPVFGALGGLMWALWWYRWKLKDAEAAELGA